MLVVVEVQKGESEEEVRRDSGGEVADEERNSRNVHVYTCPLFQINKNEEKNLDIIVSLSPVLSRTLLFSLTFILSQLRYYSSKRPWLLRNGNRNIFCASSPYQLHVYCCYVILESVTTTTKQQKQQQQQQISMYVSIVQRIV